MVDPPVHLERAGRRIDDASPEVFAILRTSCFDGHSREARWPWYSRGAPISWRVVNGVSEGREHLNYVAAHPGARLTNEQKTTRRRWAS